MVKQCILPHHSQDQLPSTWSFCPDPWHNDLAIYISSISRGTLHCIPQHIHKVVIFLATLSSHTKWQWGGDCSHKSDHTRTDYSFIKSKVATNKHLGNNNRTRWQAYICVSLPSPPRHHRLVTPGLPELEVVATCLEKVKYHLYLKHMPTFSAVRFHTVTVWPIFSKLETMPLPIRPSPRNPILRGRHEH